MTDDPMADLVTLVDAIRASPHPPGSPSATRIVEIVRQYPSLATSALRAFNDMVRSHGHPQRQPCERCEALERIIIECERAIAASLPPLDEADNDSTAH